MKENNLWQRVNYIIPDKFIARCYIIEYDISKANINVLFSSGLISKQEYDWYFSLPKLSREIYIGQKENAEKEVSGNSITEDTINDGILRAKHLLIQSNNLYDIEIVRIANDAVAVLRGEQLSKTRFVIDNNYPDRFVEFKLSFVATSMLVLKNVIIFFNSETEEVNVKGIKKDKHNLHTKFLTEICKIMSCMEYSDFKSALRLYHEFYEDYVHLRLSPEYYREFNAESGYRLKYNGKLQVPSSYGLFWLPEGFDLENLDISYNIYILRLLYGIILSQMS